MSRRAGLLLAILVLLLVSQLAPLPAGEVRLVPVFPGVALEHPVLLTHAGDRSGRLFVVEKRGRVLALPPGATAATLFLDLQDRVGAFGGNDERGLLGLAFAPDFATSGALYVNYTARPKGSPTRISRLLAPGPDHTRADPASEEVLLAFEQPYANHNGGGLAFGPDGYLYVGTGDGGAGGDPLDSGQRLDTLLGKILRLDVRGRGEGTAYRIPVDNPLQGPGQRREIYAWGLRNPWRFGFDRLSGDLWVGDVGQNRHEEIDRVTRGGNYGWRVMEGFSCFFDPTRCDPEGSLPPVADYDREQGISVTGGSVYRGTQIPGLVGTYVYGDFGTGTVWGLRARPGKGVAPPGHRVQDGFEVRLLARTRTNISSFGEDEAGEVYLVDYTGGALYRLGPG